VEPTGIREVELKAGGSYARLAGVAHNVVNVNPFEFRFIEIELKAVHINSRAANPPG
jgi:mannose-6-phosphate isomerase-like protein (cupin superfamily)